MRTIDPSEIPKDVIDAATTVAWFFKNRGILQWRLGEIQSRTPDAPASKAEANARQVALLEDAIDPAIADAALRLQSEVK